MVDLTLPVSHDTKVVCQSCPEYEGCILRAPHTMSTCRPTMVYAPPPPVDLTEAKAAVHELARIAWRSGGIELMWQRERARKKVDAAERAVLDAFARAYGKAEEKEKNDG